MAKRLVEKLRLQVDELRQLVNMNPHFDLREVEGAVRSVEEIVLSLRDREIRKMFAKKRGHCAKK